MSKTFIPGFTDKRAGFAELGRIRKGNPQVQGQAPSEHDGFRMDFNPEEEEAKNAFEALYEDRGGLQPKKLDIYLPFAEADRVWEVWYEAYQGGRLVAQAAGNSSIDNHTVYFRSLVKNGERVVHDWKGTTTLNHNEIQIKPGQHAVFDQALNNGKGPVIYHNNQNIPQYCGMQGRLRVMIRNLPFLGYMTVMTGSKRDIANISSELAGFEEIGNYIGKGLTGIPIYLYRRGEQVTVPGQNITTTKHFIHMRVDPEWVAITQLRMAKAAYTGEFQIDPGDLPALPETVDGEFSSVMNEEDYEDFEMPEMAWSEKDIPGSAKDYRKFYEFALKHMTRDEAKAILDQQTEGEKSALKAFYTLVGEEMPEGEGE